MAVEKNIGTESEGPETTSKHRGVHMPIVHRIDRNEHKHGPRKVKSYQKGTIKPRLTTLELPRKSTKAHE